LPRPLPCFAQVDSGVGAIVGALQSRGMLEASLVVFLGDNGGVFGSPFCNGALRGGKGLG
jgi:arylsulfatase A-like enzyme